MESEKAIIFRVGVVLPAAGCGERMKLQTPKQFCKVNGRPLVCYTIDCFHRLPWIQQIVIATSAGHVELLRELTAQYGFHKVTVVEGGSTRHRSISAAVTALQQVDSSVEVVVIHDAVRPLVSPDILGKIAAAAYTHGAAGVCRPLVSTVIARDTEQRLIESLDRSCYFSSEMPQAFQVPVIAKAYSQCTHDDFDFGTECLLLAMKYSGVKAQILDGSADLWKVTYKKDLFAAEAVLKEHFTRVAIINTECWVELVDSITAELHTLQLQVVEQSKPEAAAGDATAVKSSANTFVVLHTHLATCHLEDFSDQNIGSTSTETYSRGVNRESSFTGPVKSDRHTLGSTINLDDDVNFVNGITDCDSVGPQSNLLLDRLMSVQSRLLPSHSSSQLMDCTFVHVFVVSTQTEGDEVELDLSRVMLKLSKGCHEQGVLVYGVLASREAAVDIIGEMTASIIQRGHRTFSGQLFLAT